MPGAGTGAGAVAAARGAGTWATLKASMRMWTGSSLSRATWLHAFDVDAASCCVLRVEPWATSSERMVVSSSIACSVDPEGAEGGPGGTGASRTARLDGDGSGCDSLEPSPDGDPTVCMCGVRGGEELGRSTTGAGVLGGLANMSPSP